MTYTGNIITGQKPYEEGVSGTIKVTLEATSNPKIFKITSFEVSDSLSYTP